GAWNAPSRRVVRSDGAPTGGGSSTRSLVLPHGLSAVESPAMLSARDLTLRRGPEPLFEQVNFTIFRGNKCGLTGANGAGKTSLFAALRGELGPDRGDIDRPAALKIAHVEQEVAASDRAAIEFVLDGDTELRRVMAAIEDAERCDAAMELAELYASLQAIDGYRARARAASLMHGLGFKAADLGRRV